MRELVIAVLVVFAPSARAAEPDPAAARSLGAMARAGLDSGAPDEAAELFDRAAALDPHPLWQVAAGSAWLVAGEAERARERFEAALADVRLSAAGRRRAEDGLAIAKVVAPHVVTARAALAERRWKVAQAAWEEAYRLHALGLYLVAAARAAEHVSTRAFSRAVERASERSDLGADDARWLADARARIARPIAVPESPSVVPWVILIGGSAVTLAGVAGLVMGEVDRSELRDIRDGLVIGTSKTEARSLQDAADAWTLAGSLALGVGLNAVAIGATWLSVRPAPRGVGVSAEVAF